MNANERAQVTNLEEGLNVPLSEIKWAACRNVGSQLLILELMLH